MYGARFDALSEHNRELMRWQSIRELVLRMMLLNLVKINIREVRHPCHHLEKS